MRIVFLALIGSTLLAILSRASAAPKPSESIAVALSAETIEVTVPVSQLILSFPRAAFLQSDAGTRGVSRSPRYFRLDDQTSGSIISGWFEPAKGAADLKKSWLAEMEGLKKNGFSSPLNVEESEIDGWRTILYGIAAPTGSSSHIRASLVRSGTWIDLHLSVSSEISPEASRRSVTELLKSIRVTVK